MWSWRDRSDVGSKSSHVLVVVAWNVFPIHSLLTCNQHINVHGFFFDFETGFNEIACIILEQIIYN